MKSYEEWDITIPSVPPRSRFYRLKPIGIETPYVESLASYIARLANAHCVLPNMFVKFLVQEEQKLSYKDIISNDMDKIWNHQLRTLNGIGPIPRKWTELLQNLTFLDNLRFLSMLVWEDVIAIGGLLRQYKAWCPRCYDEWRKTHKVIYEPLIWSLNSVNICPKHQRQFVQQCSNCPKMLSCRMNFSYLGFCPYCSHWLGNDTTPHFTDVSVLDGDEWKYDCWVAEVVGELLAGTPSLVSPPSKMQIAVMMGNLLERLARGNMRAFARLLKITRRSLLRYFQGDSAPHFENLLKLCYTLSITPLSFFIDDTNSLNEKRYSVLDDLPKASQNKGKFITDDDVLRMRQALETVLVSIEIEPFPSLREVARRIGYPVTTVRTYCPDLSLEVTARSRQHWNREDMRTRMRQLLEDTLANVEPLPLKAAAEQLGCLEETLHQYFPDLCQRIILRYHARFDDEKIQQRLQEVLESKNEVSSVAELARQLGYTRELVRLKFPNLCKLISARWRAEQKKRHAEQLVENHEKIRLAMISLHNQDIYPSSAQVSKYLNDQLLRRRENHEIWKEILEELGY